MTVVNGELDSPRLAHSCEEFSATRQFRTGKAFAAELGIRPGDRVLDVGCGTGLLAENVAELVGVDGNVIGIDPLPQSIDLPRSRERANLRFTVGTAYDLAQFEPGSFDLVHLNAALHWLPENREPLRQFHRVLRTPAGIVAVGEKS